MKSVNFFIDRPVSATIFNLLIMVCGVLAFKDLLIDEYPQVIVPKIKIHTPYSNASAETVEKEITAPIEEAMSLVEGIDSISSSSQNGNSEVRLKFLSHISMDRAVMQVSEQLARIAPYLPEDADSPQLKRGEGHGEGFIYLGVKSKTLQGSALTHFARTHIKSHFQGIDGVAEVFVMGAPYAMNIVLDTLAMHTQKVSPGDVVKVLKENEILLQAGRMHTGEPISLDVVAKDAQDYRRMIVGKNGDAAVLLGDIAQVNLIHDDREDKIRADGEKAVVIGISKAPDGNNLAVAKAIHAMVDKVNEENRDKALVTIENDRSVFVRASLESVFHAILEACVLVILIIFLFLRHLRATLVPLVTIPISLMGTFFALKIFGLSINTITLLAMVLAVGLVVDDAIVVLENIFRYREEGLDAFAAARKGAAEIGFAIIAMTITLMSVFLPLAFVSDITGVILREFAITLAASVLISGFVALTLSPMMCSYLLKHQPKENKLSQKIDNGIKRVELAYEQALAVSFKYRRFMFIGLLLLLCGGVFLYSRLEANLLPKEDRGLIGAHIESVPGYDLDDLDPYVTQVEELFLKRPEIDHSLVFGFDGGVQVISVLKPWNKRSLHAETIVADIRKELETLPTIQAFPWSWNVGLSALSYSSHGRADIVVALKTVGSYESLETVAAALVDKMRSDGIVVDPRSDLNMNEKAYRVKMLRDPQSFLGIDEKTISLTLQTYANRMRASEFKLEGQRYKVNLLPDIATTDLHEIYVMNKNKEAVPLSVVADVKKVVQAPVLKHLNQMRVAHVLASLKEGSSLGDAKDYLDKAVKEVVPQEISVSFEGAMAMHKSGSQTFMLLFFAGLIFIFAVMAIQFEGIIDPLIILFTVPLACLGGVLFLWATKTGTNLYTQVGMLTLIGLITKHGILLTEFVSQQRKLHMDLAASVFLAARLRFRPIVMTTLATILGAVPLVLSRGAGVEARASVGFVIIGGMIFGTLLTLFVLPSVIYAVHATKARYLKSSL